MFFSLPRSTAGVPGFAEPNSTQDLGETLPNTLQSHMFEALTSLPIPTPLALDVASEYGAVAVPQVANMSVLGDTHFSFLIFFCLPDGPHMMCLTFSDVQVTLRMDVRSGLLPAPAGAGNPSIHVSARAMLRPPIRAPSKKTSLHGVKQRK